MYKCCNQHSVNSSGKWLECNFHSLTFGGFPSAKRYNAKSKRCKVISIPLQYLTRDLPLCSPILCADLYNCTIKTAVCMHVYVCAHSVSASYIPCTPHNPIPLEYLLLHVLYRHSTVQSDTDWWIQSFWCHERDSCERKVDGWPGNKICSFEILYMHQERMSSVDNWVRPCTSSIGFFLRNTNRLTVPIILKLYTTVPFPKVHKRWNTKPYGL